MSIRADTEEIKLDERALEFLAQAGGKTSLRYVVQLLTPSAILAKTNGHEVVTEDEVKEIKELFLDGRESARLLMRHKDKYLL